jgi:hypothetical protein
VIKRMGLLAGGALACWVVVIYPARLLGGEAAVVQSAVAAALCLAPSLATLAWACRTLERSPEQLVIVVLGGMLVRMAFVLGAGTAVYALLPDFRHVSFWIWVLVFYLITLTLEMVLLLAGRPETRGP